ncbi:MAG: hypothetical protein AAF320_06585, partial [Myxococcota bacterium]
MIKHFSKTQAFLFPLLALFGCSDEQDYRSSIMQQFVDNASGILQVQGISSLAGLVTDDVQTAAVNGEVSLQDPKEFSRKAYQTLDGIIPKKSEIFDRDKGILTYTIDLNTISDKIPGAVGKHMQTLCTSSEHIATVKIREIHHEGSEEFSVSIEITCQEDGQPSFIVLATPHMGKMRWEQKSDKNLLQVFQNAIHQSDASQPTLLVRLENHTHSQITDAQNMEESKFILQDWDADLHQNINMDVSWNFGVKQSQLGMVHMESDEIMQQLLSFRSKQSTSPLPKRALHTVASSSAYGPNSAPYASHFRTKFITQNNGSTNNSDDEDDKEENRILKKEVGELSTILAKTGTVKIVISKIDTLLNNWKKNIAGVKLIRKQNKELKRIRSKLASMLAQPALYRLMFGGEIRDR